MTQQGVTAAAAAGALAAWCHRLATEKDEKESQFKWHSLPPLLGKELFLDRHTPWKRDDWTVEEGNWKGTDAKGKELSSLRIWQSDPAEVAGWVPPMPVPEFKKLYIHISSFLEK